MQPHTYRVLEVSFIDVQCFVVFLCSQHLACWECAGFLTRTYFFTK